jgi:hypothetical protein
MKTYKISNQTDCRKEDFGYLRGKLSKSAAGMLARCSNLFPRAVVDFSLRYPTVIVAKVAGQPLYAFLTP